MRFKKAFVSLCHFTAMPAVMIPSAVNAQGAPATEPVVISASRRPEPLWETPAAIGFLGSAELDAAGPRVQAAEALQRLAGISAADRGNYAQDPQLSVRGFGARAAFGVRGIRLISDGIPASIPDGQGQASSFAMSSAERIELLRGPMAVLHGNASGAVIQTFTRLPPEGLSFDAQAYAGSLGLRKSSIQASFREAASDALIDYTDFSIDGYRINSAASRNQLHGIYRYQWSDAAQIRLVAQRWDQPYAQDPAGLTLDQFKKDPRQAGTNTLERRVRKQTAQDQLGLAFDYRLHKDTDLSVYTFAGRRENLQYLVSNNWIGLDRDYQGLGTRLSRRTSALSIPIRWSLSVERESSDERRQSGSSLLGEKQGDLSRNEVQSAVSEQAVLIAHADVSERFSVFGGIRHGKVSLRANDNFLSDGQDGSGKVSYQQTSPVLGVQHWLNRDQQLFLSAGKGYETPTLAELSYISDLQTPGRIVPRFNTQIAASHNRQWELGWRGRRADIHRWELVAFQVRSSNEIVVDRSSAGQNSFRNAPGTERYGLELGWHAKWSPQWQSVLSLTSMKANYRGSWLVNGRSLDGHWMPAIPDQTVFAEMRFQQAQSLSALELRHVGKRYANDLNTLSAAAFQTVALRSQYNFMVGKNRLTAIARVDNLFDRRYVGSVIVNNASPFEPSPGRSVWMGLRASLPVY